MNKIKTEVVVGETRLNYCIIDSPVGKLLLAGDDQGLQHIQFECNIKVKKSWIEKPQAFKDIKNQLNEYFNQSRTRFDLKLNPIGTDFQLKVWDKLKKIAPGTTKYYSEIAEEINNPKAARAIGMANNKNPIPIIIPCHRVIGKNGSLTGFASGLGIKKQLLDLENNHIKKNYNHNEKNLQ